MDSSRSTAQDRDLLFDMDRNLLGIWTKTGAVPGNRVKEILRQALIHARAERVDRVLVTCDTDNVASMLLADARAAVTAAAGARAKGEAPLAPRQAARVAKEARATERKRNTLTLAVAFESFLLDRDLKPKTAKTYRDVWQHVPDAMRATPFADIHAGAIADLHRTLGRKGKKRTANKLIGQTFTCIKSRLEV